MKNLCIHYFTATGNTLHAVNIMKNQFLKKGYKVYLQRVEGKVNYTNQKYDYHIFAFSIFAFSASILMKKYIQKIPKGNNEKVAILAICGGLIIKNKLLEGWPGQAIEQIEDILTKKNYNVFLSNFISYPDNWTQFTNPPDEKDKLIINHYFTGAER